MNDMTRLPNGDNGCVDADAVICLGLPLRVLFLGVKKYLGSA